MIIMHTKHIKDVLLVSSSFSTTITPCQSSHQTSEKVKWNTYANLIEKFIFLFMVLLGNQQVAYIMGSERK